MESGRSILVVHSLMIGVWTSYLQRVLQMTLLAISVEVSPEGDDGLSAQEGHMLTLKEGVQFLGICVVTATEEGQDECYILS